MSNFPRGAGFGPDANRKRPALVDYGWTALNGSRAQRRAARKLLRQAAKSGNEDARAALADLDGVPGG